MTAVILVLSLGAVFAVGYFLMGRLDRFLLENRCSIEREEEKEAPSSVMLTDDMSEEELVEEIRRFRKSHKNIRILLQKSPTAEKNDPSDNNSSSKR